jgi:hypothetical protein
MVWRTRTNHLLHLDHRENDASNNYSTVACVCIAMGMCLLSRCLATIRGYTYRQHGDLISITLFSKIGKVG